MTTILEDKEMLDRVASNPLTGILRSVNESKPNTLLLAGGSVLKPMMYPEQKGNVDYDLYVNAADAGDVLTKIKAFVTEVWSSVDIRTRLQPAYCNSFLRKNGILLMVQFVNTTRGYNYSKEIQVMITKGSPLDVVTSFDLTCCQVWFDGTNVKGSHLDLTLKKEAYLQEDYVQSLINGNIFIIRRIEKYKERGFNIKLDGDHAISNLVSRRPHKKGDTGKKKFDDSSWEEIIVKYAVSTLYTSSSQSLNNMTTFNKMMKMGRFNNNYTYDTSIKFGVETVFQLVTRGYTMKNLIAVFKLNQTTLGNLINLMLAPCLYQGEEFPIIMLKTLKPYITSDVYTAYVKNYGVNYHSKKGGDGTRMFNETEYTNTISPMIPFNENIPFTFDHPFNDVDHSDTFDDETDTPEGKSDDYDDQIFGVVEGYDTYDGVKPVSFDVIPNTPYYPPIKKSDEEKKD